MLTTRTVAWYLTEFVASVAKPRYCFMPLMLHDGVPTVVTDLVELCGRPPPRGTVSLGRL
jgi:hypothetical protein